MTARAGQRQSRRRRIALAALAVSVVVLLFAAPWIHAQWRALVVIGEVVEDAPLVGVTKRLTRSPRIEEQRIAGSETTVAYPDGEGPWPTVVFITGASPTGRRHPQVQALLRGLARGGFLAAAPDIAGLAEGRLSERAIEETAEFVEVFAARDDVDDHRVTLAGVSVGASLSLLVAADDGAARQVSLVAGIAPLVDIEETIRVATTGRYATVDGELREYEVEPFLSYAVAKLALGALRDEGDRVRFGAALVGLSVDDDDAYSQAIPAIRGIDPDQLSREGRAWRRLLANTDAQAFDELREELDEANPGVLERLSPLAAAPDVMAQVLIATSPTDSYVPLSQQQLLVQKLPNADLTVTSALDHAIPDASQLLQLIRFDGWLMRVLHAAAD